MTPEAKRALKAAKDALLKVFTLARINDEGRAVFVLQPNASLVAIGGICSK